MAVEAAINGFKTVDIYDPKQITSNGSGFYTCFETNSPEHAKAIALVINNPAIAKEIYAIYIMKVYENDK